MQQLGWTGPGSIGYDGRGSPPMVRNPPPDSRSRRLSQGRREREVRGTSPRVDAAGTQPTAFRFLIDHCVDYPTVRIPAQAFSHATVGVLTRHRRGKAVFSHATVGDPKFSHATVGVMFSHATVGVGGYRVSFAVSVIREAGAGRTMRSRESQSAKKPRDGNGRLRKSGS